MNRIMEIPGFKGVIVEKMDQLEGRVILHVSLPKKEHTCPNCGEKTKRVHDYRIQKVNHLKWFERLSTIFYKRRRYVCACGKRFSEACPLVDRYQRYSKEWNQLVRIRCVKAKTFKEAADVMGTSASTVIRRYKGLVKAMPTGVQLPRVIKYRMSSWVVSVDWNGGDATSAGIA